MARKFFSFSFAAMILTLGCLLALGLSACVPQPPNPVKEPASTPTTAPTMPSTPQATATNSSSAFSLAGKNLIVNGDAESGLGTDGGTVAAAIPGWKTVNNFNVVAYGSPNGYPDMNTPGPDERGKNFFCGGPNDEVSSAYQVIDVSSAAAILNTGKIHYTLSAWTGGTSGQNDHVELSAQFLGPDNTVLASAALPKVLDSDRAGETELLFKKISGNVPVGTVKIKVEMKMIRTDGSDNDAYADNLSLVLSA